MLNKKIYTIEYRLKGAEVPLYAEVGARSKQAALEIFKRTHADVKRLRIELKRR